MAQNGRADAHFNYGILFGAIARSVKQHACAIDHHRIET
jgi:hypothetical protein